jgi:probable F420-dependent oxidoreductase
VTRLGLAVPIEGLALRESLELAVHAQELGYTDAWSYEVCDADGFTPLAWLASRAERLRLGISVVPAFTRPPALLAMTCAALQELAEGRFVLGLGPSSPNVVGRWMGGDYALPLTRVRETVEALRLALTGEKASYSGRTVRMEDFRLALPPAHVPVMLGALGPRMRRLAGEIGDGIVMVFTTPEGTPALLEPVVDGARACGRDPGALDVVAKLFVAVDEDDADLRALLRRLVTGYGTVPAYNRMLASEGFDREARAMAEAWANGDRRGALAAASDELLERLFIFGDEAACLRRLREHADAGARTLLIAPVTAARDPAERRARVRRTIERVARLTPSPAAHSIETR